ncbi:hypothetical protein AgCh_035143 [Apium graveolens]
MNCDSIGSLAWQKHYYLLFTWACNEQGLRIRKSQHTTVFCSNKSMIMIPKAANLEGVAKKVEGQTVLCSVAIGDFWNTTTTRTVVHENQAATIVINCTIKGQHVKILEDDVNKALGIPTDKLVEAPTQDELYEFMDFINYSERIILDIMNKKALHIGGAEHQTRNAIGVKRKPTISSSQKDEVSKKKRNGVTLTVITKSGEDQHETESPLVNQRRGVSIKKSIHPNAPCTESAQPAPEAIQVYGRRNKYGTHSEGTSFEAPSSIQGELPTLTSEKQSLISQISSLPTALESDSQVQAKSNDLVQETLLTTQTLHLDGERLLAGIDPDDTIKNMGDSSVFTEDPMDVSNAPSCTNQSSQTVRSTIANDPVLGEARIAHSGDSVVQDTQGFETGAHGSNPVKSPSIQLEVPTTSVEQ